MKTALVVSGKLRSMETAKAISRTLEGRGYESDIIDCSLDTDKKLIFYDYLIFLTEPLSFFGKNIQPYLKTYLRNCGSISGKRAACVLCGRALRKNSVMQTFMRLVEGEGVILKTSAFISSGSEAVSFAKSINVERNY